MKDEDLYSSGIFASELDDAFGEEVDEEGEGAIIEPDLDDLDEEDEDLYESPEDDDPDGNYNPMDDYRKDGWE